MVDEIEILFGCPTQLIAVIDQKFIVSTETETKTEI
jgi:hypothetical protein